MTTAAAVWFIGLGWYLIAAIATVYAVVVPRIPHVKTWLREQQDE